MQITKGQHGGRWYTIYKQEWGQDCGPTSVAIAKMALTGIGADIDWMRSHTKAALVSPKIQSKIEDLGLKSRDSGTKMDKLPAVAKSAGLNADKAKDYGSTLLQNLKTAGREKVFICHIGWGAGGGHFVVVPFVDPKGEVIVLDPYYGLATTNNLGRYLHGSFSGWAIEVRR